MKNRIVENWLINANELSYKIPFCQLLLSKGYKIIHTTRDGPFEQGKDIIVIDPDGIPCGIQLKGGNISLTDWRNYIGEINQLVEVPIIHPSIDKKLKRRAILVTNGELSEEVRREISDRNEDWEKRGHPKLEVIVKGELLEDFQKFYGDYLPMDITDLSDFLYLYQSSGRTPLDKRRFAQFLEKTLLLDLDNVTQKTKIIQRINSSVVITSYLLHNKIKSDNHMAIIDTWIMLLAYIYSITEKFDLKKGSWQQTVDLIYSSIDSQFEELIKELKDRTNLIEGNPLEDVPVYKARVTTLLGYLAGYGIYKQLRYKNADYGEIFYYLNRYTKQIVYDAEVQSPYLILNTMFRKLAADPNHADILLTVITKKIIIQNEPFKGIGLPDPYHDVEEVYGWLLGLNEINYETFRNQSYTLKTTVLLMARRGLREELTPLWRPISYIQFIQFQPKEKWQHYFWLNEDGELNERFPEKTQSWKALVEEANKDNSEKLPLRMIENPEFIPLFLLIYPHRLIPELVLFLDSKL